MNVYHVPKLHRNFTIDARWVKMPWLEIPSLHIDQYCWERPSHFPGVQAKLAYDMAAIYLIFQVEDRFVRAICQDYQDAVAEDSCVEFFFTPGENLDQGYFNLEINCGGTALFHHQKGRNVADQPVSASDFEQVQVAHTLPKIVDPEIQESVTWSIEYRLPFDMLSAYAPTECPASGKSWRVNLYKCADGSSHPHWLTWSPVNTPEPDFHRPEFFGKLVFG